MVKILSDKKIQCAFCKGTGIHPGSRVGKCVSCRGQGEVKVKSSVIQCHICKGRGKSLNSPKLSCLQCKGIGVIEKLKSESKLTDVIGDRFGEIVKRLRWTRKEIQEREAEIKKKLKIVKPYVKKIKKETLI